jgi:hypothetical protein
MKKKNSGATSSKVASIAATMPVGQSPSPGENIVNSASHGSEPAQEDTSFGTPKWWANWYAMQFRLANQ